MDILASKIVPIHVYLRQAIEENSLKLYLITEKKS